MKALWVINTPIYINNKNQISCRGGWIAGALSEIAKFVSVVVACPLENVREPENIEGIEYYYFAYNQYESKKIVVDSKLVDYFVQMLQKEKPDIIHIWGTEYLHSVAMVRAAMKINMISRVVVNLQGLNTALEKQMFVGIPFKYIFFPTIAEIRNGRGIAAQAKTYKKRGNYEREILQAVSYVIGRTDWDQAIARQINSECRYFHCNETLRDVFYGNECWKYENCIKHSIFVTQPDYPIKGFHMLLEALPIIKRKFPDVCVYATGNGFRDNGRTYNRYINKLIRQNHLEDNISFLGELTKEQMKEQFLKSNVFVSSSSMENESNSLSEAMILGVPAVASYVGGVTGRIQHGIDGFLYPYNEPYMLAFYIISLFEDKKKMEAFSMRAKEHASIRNNPVKNRQEMLKIYNTIVVGAKNESDFL